MLDRQPFVYVIRDTTNNKRYGGVKFAKNCKPADLLTTYFTSSKVVKKLISEGVEFTIEKIILFDSKEDAIEFEELMLSMVDASNSSDWYNQAIGRAINPDVVRQSCLDKYGVENWMLTEEAKESSLGFKEGNTFGCFSRSEETKRRMSIAFTGREFSESHKRKISEAKTGTRLSQEVKQKMSENRQRGKHPKAIPIHTPDGDFECMEDAAEFYDVTSGCIRKWMKVKSELFYKIPKGLTMPSQYLKCDQCSKTLGAEQVITDRHVGIGDTPALLSTAIELGWQINKYTHICPDYSKTKESPCT